MKHFITFTSLFMFATMAYGGHTIDLNDFNAEKGITLNETKKDRKMARVYRRANSKVKRELFFMATNKKTFTA